MARAWPLLLLALAAPVAAAHAVFDAGAALGGGASVHLELSGAPLVAAGAPLEARVRTDAEGPVRLRLVPPSGAPRAWVDAAAPVPLVLDAPGAWRVEVMAGGASAGFDVVAWPAARAFVEPAGDALRRGVVVAGAGEAVAVRLVDAAGQPLAVPADAVARVRGPDGEARDVPLGSDGVVAAAWSVGAWSVEALAPSLGLAPGARPPLLLQVVPAEEAGVYGLEGAREVPVPPWLVVAAVVAAALTRARPSRRSCSR